MLRLFYVDESRDRAPVGHHFAVGLLADGISVALVETALDNLMAAAFELGICHYDAEIHAFEIFHGSGSWQAGSIQQRIELLDSLTSVIVESGVEVIARGVNLAEFGRKYPGMDPHVWAFSNLLERLNERLLPASSHALVISDQQSEHRAAIQSDVASSKRHGTDGYRRQKFSTILDTAHFVDSKLSRMVQLADLAAFVLRRRASIPSETDRRLEALMARLHDRVFSAVPEPKGQYHTIRRYFGS
jgi:hypothetical protein